MQALSFAVHIPLVAFGMAFPAMVLFAEWRYLRTGDRLYRTLARRWSRVMLALFAVGVVTGTILSFELGLLWPGFVASFGNVFGLGFALEGFSFFVEAIFIAIYVYGWDRLGPRLHFMSGIPVAIAGVTGSFFVISVNGWMNHPGGFTLQDGRAVDVRPWSALFGNSYVWHEWIHMYFAGYIVAGFLIASFYAWGYLRGRRGRYQRTALTIALTAAAVVAPVQIVVGDWAAREVRRRLPRSRWFYRAVLAAGPLSVVALIAGWVTTEVGRQPWVVYRVMRTSEAVTGAEGIPIGYGTLVAVYIGLYAAVAWFLRRFSRIPLEAGLDDPAPPHPDPGATHAG